MRTVCFDVYVPLAGEKVGVAAVGNLRMCCLVFVSGLEAARAAGPVSCTALANNAHKNKSAIGREPIILGLVIFLN
jgi:hypothetical protein